MRKPRITTTDSAPYHRVTIQGFGPMCILRNYELMHMVPAPGTPRMRVECFVTPEGSVSPARMVGFAKLPAVLTLRPPGHKYAVAEFNTAIGKYMLVNMYDLSIDSSLQILSLGWHKAYPTVDAAIMAALLRKGGH